MAKSKPKAKAKAAAAQPKADARAPRMSGTAADITQILYDNFKGWEAEDTDVRKVEGLTLRETLQRDRKRWRVRELTMGGDYYRELKQKFKNQLDPKTQIRSPNPDAVGCKKLVKAITAAVRKKRDLTLLRTYVTTTRTPPNGAEAAALAKILFDMKITCKLQITILAAILRYFAAQEIHLLFPEIWKIIKSRVDLILTAMWKRSSRDHKMRRDTWLNLHWKLVIMVAPPVDLQKVRDCGEAWHTVQQSIHAIVAESDIGNALYGFTIGALLSEKIKEIAEKHLDKKDMEWTEQVVSETVGTILTECEDVHNIDMLPHKRWIESTYAGCKITLQVTSLEAEVEWRVQAAWKSVAVTIGSLKRLSVEDFETYQLYHPIV